MKIYPVLSSDLYALSCVPVSMLERMGDIQLREHFNHGGSLKFLVAQETMGDLETRTGYMSKHVEYGDISAVLAQDFKLSWLQQCASDLSDYVKNVDLDQLSVIIDSIPAPYIISAFYLSAGHIRGMEGYALSDALSTVVPQVKYASIFADSASLGVISSRTIDSISAKIPAEASEDNQLADKEYVSALVHMNASNFRGTFGLWRQVPTVESGYLSDRYGNSMPTDNDYMIVREVNTLEEDGGTWPTDISETERQGTWRFRYTGEWGDGGETAKNRWRPEYRIEHYNFTDQQIAAINSGITHTTRVVRQNGSSFGDSYRGIYVDINGEVQQMSCTVKTSVPDGAKFTETKVLPAAAGGVEVTTDSVGSIIQSKISLKVATSTEIGGIQLGRGLAKAPADSHVDVATAVRIVEVDQTDLRTPEDLSGVFGEDLHVGALMIVKRGYSLADAAAYTGYVYTGSGWEALAGNCCADNVILKDDIQFEGDWISVGNISNVEGGVFPCGGKSVSDAFRMIFGGGNAKIRVARPQIGITEFTYDGAEHTPIVGEIDSRIIVDGVSSAVDVATPQTMSFTMDLPQGDSHEWSDGTTGRLTVDWSIAPEKVSLPDLTCYYTGSETGPNFDETKYTVTSGISVATDVGNNYSCDLNLLNSQNRVWEDGWESDMRTVTWSIQDLPDTPDAVAAMDADGNIHTFKQSQFDTAGASNSLAYVNQAGQVLPPFNTVRQLSSASSLVSLSVMTANLYMLSAWAFGGCSCLISVDAPFITDIQPSAFISATALSVINVPYVQSIGRNAFYNAYPHTAPDVAGKMNPLGSLSVMLSGVSELNVPTVDSTSFNASSAYVYVANSDVAATFGRFSAWPTLIARNLVTMCSLA